MAYVDERQIQAVDEEIRVPRLEYQPANATKGKYSSPFKLFAITIASIFAAELLIMLLLNILPPLPLRIEMLLDAFLLSFLVFPILYIFLLRPMILNINERKRAEVEREKVIYDLKDAITKVDTLSGLLPICAKCKKIRDDNGYWNDVELYIKGHSEAEFSHSICPDCAEELYLGYYKKDKIV